MQRDGDEDQTGESGRGPFGYHIDSAQSDAAAIA